MGKNCVKTTNENKVFTKHTFVDGIINLRCVGWREYKQGTMNARLFVEFVRAIIERYHMGDYLFIFRKARAYKGQGIRNLIKETRNTFQNLISYNP
eukprot:scaffold1347_cov350-Pavlova_lutheri.AAC.4